MDVAQALRSTVQPTTFASYPSPDGEWRIDLVIHGCTIVDPVYVEDGVTIRGSTIGPNVTLCAGAVVEDSQLRDTLVGAKSRIVRSTLRNSLIGDEAVVEGMRGELTIGDHSEVRGQESGVRSQGVSG